MNSTDSTDSCGNMQQYRYFDNRLATFESWPKQMIPDKYSLAKSGFYYTGKGDKVKCFSCGVGVSDWERTDESNAEHIKWSPNCEYLRVVGYKRQQDVPDKPRGFGDGQAIKTAAKPIYNWGFGESKPQTPLGKAKPNEPSVSGGFRFS